MNSREITGLSLSLILSFLMITPIMMISVTHTDFQSKEHESSRYMQSGDIFHTPILIESDDDFSLQSWPGAGIEGNPYRIENLNITSAGYENCIDIRNTLAHVLIKNCTVRGNAANGIYLYNVSNVFIEDIVAINSNIGIAIGISSGNSVSYSNITNCNHGIRLQQSNDNEIANNTISSNGWRCIYLEHSHGNQLYLNNLSGGFYSIYNTYSDSNVIHNNTCQMNGREGLYLWYSDNLTISGNSFEGTPTYPTVLFDGVESLTFNYNVLTGNGVKVYAQVTDVEAIGNTMNGRPLVFLTGVDGITFSGDAGQIILLECTNVTISNQVISDVGYGIHIQSCTGTILKDSIIANTTWNGINVAMGSVSTTIQNITCYGNEDWGLYVTDSPYTIIRNSTFYDNGEDGIYLFDSDYSMVEDNICYRNNRAGIHFHATEYTTAVDNNLTTYTYGVLLDASTYCNVSYNIIFGSVYGVYLAESDSNLIYMNEINESAEQGIAVDNSHMNVIANNSFKNNYLDGITIWAQSFENVVTNNTLQYSNIGLVLEDGSINTFVYWNQFIESGLYQIEDNGDNSAIHNNYYSDYTGIDSNFDGIGDTPYLLNGTMGNEDPYPLMNPGFSPVINYWTEPPADQFSEYGTEFEYQLHQTGAPIVSALLSDTSHFSIDMTLTIRNTTILAVGLYHLEIQVRNTDGYYLKGIFTLNVSDTTGPTWIDFPDNQIREYNEQFRYQVRAYDISGIDYWELVTDQNFRIDWNGTINQNEWLPVGVYPFEVRVYDIYGNLASGTFNLSIVDTILPVIDNYGDERFFYVDSGEELEWEVFEDNLVSYVIFMDGIEVESGNETDNFSQIHYSCAGLGAGVYNFTLVVTDAGGNVASSSIMVTLTNQPTSTSTYSYPTPSSPSTVVGPDFLAIFIIVACIVGVIAIIVIAGYRLSR